MATLDTLLFVPEGDMVDDGVTPVEEVVRCPGGKGIVAAAAIQQEGGEVVPFSLLGAGSEFADLLPAGLDRRYLLGMLENDSRTWITISHAQKVVTFVAQGRLPGRREESAVEAVSDFVKEVDALYLTIEHPALLRAALREAATSGVPIALNASIPLLEMLLSADRKLLGNLLARSDFVFCNHMEEPRFLHALGASDWEQAPLAETCEIVVTEGEAGGKFSEGHGSWTRFSAVPASSVQCVVGAGDTFNGAYLVARLVAGASSEESSLRGAEVAARKVAARSSMLPSGQPTSAS